jgi:hypothetical protein
LDNRLDFLQTRDILFQLNKTEILNEAQRKYDLFKSKLLSNQGNWQFYEYCMYNANPKFNIVLGDSVHANALVDQVYDCAPQSLRNVEDTITFQTFTEPNQSLRKSEFVLTYGPGALIETSKFPRMIKSYESGFHEGFNRNPLVNSTNLARWRISNPRIESYLRDLTQIDSHVFEVPTNQQLNVATTVDIYNTTPFPMFKVCYKKSHHTEGTPILFKAVKDYNYNCPYCNNSQASSIRFIQACRMGHVDDISWDFLVHHNKKCTKRKNRAEYFLWDAHGVTLQDIEIRCPYCPEHIDMQTIYNTHLRCWGEYHENGRRFECREIASVVQRQSSSLYAINALTFLKIPDRSDPLYNFLNTNRSLLVPLLMTENMLDSDFQQQINLLATYNSAIATEINLNLEVSKRPQIYEICKILNPQTKRQFIDFIYEELSVLIAGDRMESSFQIAKSHDFPGMATLIPPIGCHRLNRIETISLQRSYDRKIKEEQSNPVSIAWVNQAYDLAGQLIENHWYAGFTGIGEGIFLEFNNFEFMQSYPAYDEWNQMKSPESEEDDPLMRWARISYRPEFGWLHTFSHAVIKQISSYSGYNVATIRERIYFNPDTNVGGILIYVTSPGQDGSIGGLTGLIPNIDHIFIDAMDSLQFCSNDPLCSEIRMREEKQIGGGCYHCLFLPETSCEHRNRFLDRHLLLDD